MRDHAKRERGAMMQARAVGIPWYRRDDYEELLERFADAHKLPATYSRWLAAAAAAERRLKAGGRLVVRAELRSREFAAWCASKRLRPDSMARSHFASDAAYRAAMRQVVRVTCRDAAKRKRGR